MFDFSLAHMLSSLSHIDQTWVNNGFKKILLETKPDMTTQGLLLFSKATNITHCSKIQIFVQKSKIYFLSFLFKNAKFHWDEKIYFFPIFPKIKFLDKKCRYGIVCKVYLNL